MSHTTQNQIPKTIHLEMNSCYWSATTILLFYLLFTVLFLFNNSIF